MVLLGWLDLLYLYYVLSSLTDLTYICIQQFTQCFRCFCYRCFCLSIKSLYAEGLNGMLEKCVNTSFFPVVTVTVVSVWYNADRTCREPHCSISSLNWPKRAIGLLRVFLLVDFTFEIPFETFFGPFWNPWRLNRGVELCHRYRNLCRLLPAQWSYWGIQ